VRKVAQRLKKIHERLLVQEMTWKEKMKNNNYIKYIYDCLIGKRKERKIIETRRQILQERGMDIVRELECALTGTGAVYFMAFGSLLGMIRDGKFMTFDDDIDYQIKITEAFTWNDLERILSAAGFKKVKEFLYNEKVSEQTYEKYKLPIDFFSFYNDGKYTKVRSFVRKKGKQYKSIKEYTLMINIHGKVEPIKKMNINGVEFSAPMDPEEYLEYCYTSNWRVPDPNWNDENSSYTCLLESEIGIEKDV